jgi:hypothetical protein
MILGRVKSISALFPIAVVVIISLLASSACRNAQAGAEKALQEYLKDQGTREIKIDLLYTNPSFPDQAYVSTTVTYNFASASGSYQKEYAGYILKKDGPNWKVDRNTRYTKDETKANDLLAGKN